MRSAWSPARSMSFETLFDVFAKCELASPTDLASDFASMPGSCFGTGIPSTVLRRVRPLSAIPPAIPAAAAPTAMAGPFALPAACLTVPTRPLPLPFPLLLLLVVRAGVVERVAAVLRFARPFDDEEPDFEELAFVEPDFARPFADVVRFALLVPVLPAAFELLVLAAAFARGLAVPERLAVVLLERLVVLLLERLVPELVRLVSAIVPTPVLVPREGVAPALPRTAAN